MMAVAIILIVALVAVSVITFLIYRKIPAPKKDDKLRDDETCKNCKENGCIIRKDDE